MINRAFNKKSFHFKFFENHQLMNLFYFLTKAALFKKI